ncbi:hypothetical protein [Microbispora bryophytorum]|uniref:Uncharacterized protein n=1 Tax=Microbispora bryophytorum TaxID=1460882 RepID=A0A8H9GUQ2_9ACTN|nr:hypothetical protein [Microbispora bryophytorum]MBD3135746.1 hypothetical protein [Microbispora bryophytorum]TQS09908.1 hypothetical protein FLX07_02290 [Microbispora bryophytorum]GGN99261.1 hypothetical protein GCM10011574_04720 [Microbispora bryophytorum]
MDPVTLAIAGAVATGIATRTGESAGTALTTLIGRIRDRFRDRPAVLESEESAAAALETEFTRDPRFRQDCHGLWNQAQTGAVANSFTGQANNVIQARDIHGDITL